MFTKIIFLILLAAVLGEHTYQYTNVAKQCMEEIKVTEETIRRLVPEKEGIPIDNDTVLKFFECCFREFLDDKGELIVNDEFNDYVVTAFSFRIIDAKKSLVKLVADDCIDHCKNIKGTTKGIAAVKIMNCLKDRLHMYIDV